MNFYTLEFITFCYVQNINRVSINRIKVTLFSIESLYDKVYKIGTNPSLTYQARHFSICPQYFLFSDEYLSLKKKLAGNSGFFRRITVFDVVFFKHYIRNGIELCWSRTLKVIRLPIGSGADGKIPF